MLMLVLIVLLLPSVGGRLRHAESIPSETSTFAIIWSTIAWISTASMISSGVRSMIGIPIKSLIAATIVKTMLDICSSTIGVNAASRLAIRSGVLIPPVALIAAHISNMVAFASNPKVIASCC